MCLFHVASLCVLSLLIKTIETVVLVLMETIIVSMGIYW